MQSLTSWSSRRGSSPLSPASSRQDEWLPEARVLALCARTTLTDRDRASIAQALDQDLNWPLLLQLARYHGVAPLLQHTLQSLTIDRLPADVIESLQQTVQARTVLSHALMDELVRLCQVFDSAGVSAVPFKGPALAVMAYGTPALRDCDDLDFIVPCEQLVKAQQVLWSQGYRPREISEATRRGGNCNVESQLFVKKNSRLCVDLRWRVGQNHRGYRLDRPEVWRHMTSLELNGTRVRALAPEELIIVLSLQGAAQAWSRLRWAVDIAELLRRHRLNWRRMFATAAQWKCRRILLLGLAVAHCTMDSILPPAILRQACDDADVAELAPRMPRNLLVHQSEAVHETHVPALVLSLQDSRWHRWLYGLSLARVNHPVVSRVPTWFRFDRTLRWSGRLVDMLRGTDAIRVPVKRIAETIDRYRASAR